MTPAQRRRVAQAVLNCCCVSGSGKSGSPRGGTGSGFSGSQPFPPAIPIENCCFCPDENGNATVPRFLHLDWFDGCIGARTAILEFGGFGDPQPPICGEGDGHNLRWSFQEFFDNPHPLRPGVLFCNQGDTQPAFLSCCADGFRVECIPASGGRCFTIKSQRTRQYVGGVNGLLPGGAKLHVVSCRPFLAWFNQPLDTSFFDPDCNTQFGWASICPRCQGAPCFGVVSEA